MKTQRETDLKEHIVNRLHKRCGVCSHCGKKGCGHTSTNLPSTMNRDDVLWAINLDNYFEALEGEGK